MVAASVESKTKRKKKTLDDNIQMIIDEAPLSSSLPSPLEKVEPELDLKRGRKPKGGKLISKKSIADTSNEPIANVILHLKCSFKDLQNNFVQQRMIDPFNYNSDVPPDIMTYDIPSQYASYEVNHSEKPSNFAYINTFGQNPTEYICKTCHSKQSDEDSQNDTNDDDLVNIKNMNQKLKKLKIDLYKNTLSEKKSACFWCTYEFDNQPCYIPKYEMDGIMNGYGSFCRPECAAAYLMKENLDDSTKFERYHLLNQIYSKVYNFKNNIKPAPNPYYLLDKYYGNLTIQEYRKLLNTEHILLVIDKPMTRILPELHEDNGYFTNTLYGGTGVAAGGNSQTGGVYKVKRQSEKQQGPSKINIIKNKFGLA
jgi:hypothetical protein